MSWVKNLKMKSLKRSKECLMLVSTKVVIISLMTMEKLILSKMQNLKRQRKRSLVSPQKESGLLRESTVNVVHMAKQVKQKEEEIEFVPVQRKVMLTVLVLQKLKSVKTRHVQMTFLERNGSVVERNQ